MANCHIKFSMKVKSLLFANLIFYSSLADSLFISKCLFQTSFFINQEMSVNSIHRYPVFEFESGWSYFMPSFDP